MKRSTISRRTMLRGAGGAAMALPALEMMGGGARADGPIRRFVFCMCGVSIGACDMWRDGVARPKSVLPPHDFVTPTVVGPAYEKTIGLESIFAEQVQSDMGLVSGLHMPHVRYFPDGGAPPNCTAGFHGGTHVCQQAGKSEYSSEGNENDHGDNPCGPTADQIIADVISSPDQYMKTLPLFLEAYYNRNVAQDAVYISFVAGKPNGPKDRWGRTLAIPVQPYLNPSDIYNKLFDPSAASGTPRTKEAAEAWKRDKIGVLNAVQAKTRLLNKRLGRHDQLQMERWLGHLNTLTSQISQFDTSQCLGPPAASYAAANDPKWGHYYGYAPDPNDGIPREVYDTDAGYGNETERAQMQADLIAAAFACDRTRVVSWLMTGSQCNLNAYPTVKIMSEFHAISHGGGAVAMAKVVNWHIAPVARLVKHLQEQTDYDGSRMIDNTVILMFFEGGWGQDPYSTVVNTGMKDIRGLVDPVYDGGGRYSHSQENMIVVVGGGRNLGIQAGQHIHYEGGRLQDPNSAQHPHPAQVVLTALRRLDYTGRFGDCPNDILPEMLRIQA